MSDRSAREQDRDASEAAFAAPAPDALDESLAPHAADEEHALVDGVTATSREHLEVAKESGILADRLRRRLRHHALDIHDMESVESDNSTFSTESAPPPPSPSSTSPEGNDPWARYSIDFGLDNADSPREEDTTVSSRDASAEPSAQGADESTADGEANPDGGGDATSGEYWKAALATIQAKTSAWSAAVASGATSAAASIRAGFAKMTSRLTGAGAEGSGEAMTVDDEPLPPLPTETEVENHSDWTWLFEHGGDLNTPLPDPSEREGGRSRVQASSTSGRSRRAPRLRSANQPRPLSRSRVSQPDRMVFTRGGNPVMRLSSGTTALSNSLQSARSTIEVLNSGGRIDPTKPTLALIGLCVAVVAIIATITMGGTLLSVRHSLAARSAEQALAITATAEPSDSADSQPAAALAIASIDVISYDNDGGDHPELVSALTDGDASTVWQSRYFSSADLGQGNTVRLVVHLAAAGTVNEVVLHGPVTQGQVDLRVNDGSDPFGSAVLTSSELSETTSLKPSSPAEGTTVTLDFVTLPVDDEGMYRIKVSSIEIR